MVCGRGGRESCLCVCGATVWGCRTHKYLELFSKEERREEECALFFTVLQMSIPLGHTDFSWSAQGVAPALGHTDFSWGGASAPLAPGGGSGEGESKQPPVAPSASGDQAPRTVHRSGKMLDHCGEAASALSHYYVTTAINYTNGDPHVGHAYEAITTDVIARYHRIFGRKVFFLTGTDEHGQKIAARAAKEGLQPIDICNRYAAKFQALNKRLNISNDAYIRTTQEKHKAVAQTLWRKCLTRVTSGLARIAVGTMSGRRHMLQMLMRRRWITRTSRETR